LLVSAIVSLVMAFSARTVAEGAEDEDTLAILRDLGVDLARGYAIARPGPVEIIFGAGSG
jgi:EAL domain-containing protein (putative c-di-GMP-specific phosphodiesterase class I)